MAVIDDVVEGILEVVTVSTGVDLFLDLFGLLSFSLAAAGDGGHGRRSGRVVVVGFVNVERGIRRSLELATTVGEDALDGVGAAPLVGEVLEEGEEMFSLDE